MRSTQKDDRDHGQVKDEIEDKLSLQMLNQLTPFENKLHVDLNQESSERSSRRKQGAETEAS